MRDTLRTSATLENSKTLENHTTKPIFGAAERPIPPHVMLAAVGQTVANETGAKGMLRLNGHVARRRADGSTRVIWDDALPGFGLRVRENGKKTWVVKYRRRGRQRYETLGTVDAVAAPEARRAARALLAAIAIEGLPKPPPRVGAPLLIDYAETFWSDYARHWKPSTRKGARGILERDLIPVFGAVPLDQIRKTDVMRWRDDMSARPLVFNHALPVLSAMLAYAERLGHRPPGSNPCRRTPRYPATPKERFLSPAEYRRLGAVLAAAQARLPLHVAVIRLLALTGARLSEILTLRWEEVRPPRLLLADSKTGPKTIYLCDEAVSLLAEIEPRDGCPWVFPAKQAEGPIPAPTLSGKWVRLRKAAALPDVRLHDLRHSFASVAVNRGVSLMLIGRLLGHVAAETTARYAHLEDQSIADAAARVSRSLGQALGGAK